MRNGLAALLLLLAAAGPAAAQGDRAPPAHDEAVRQLSVILGRSHYLRILCNGSEDQRWRDAMLRMLDLEAAPGSPRRAALSDAFNEGFRREEEAYAVCSDAARETAQTLARQGRRLSDAIAARQRPD